MSEKEKQIRILLASVIGMVFIGIFIFSKFGDTLNNREQKRIEQQIEKEQTESSDSPYGIGNTESTASKTCSWCGKSFTGSHYTHLGKMADCYSTDSKTSIGFYCSMKCCSEIRRSSCPTCH